MNPKERRVRDVSVCSVGVSVRSWVGREQFKLGSMAASGGGRGNPLKLIVSCLLYSYDQHYCTTCSHPQKQQR